MWFLFRRPARVAAAQLKAPGGRPGRPSMLRLTVRALDKIAECRMVLPVLFFLVFLAALCNLCLFIQWWDKKYPRPLGILTGELLKGFGRYSPDDNHSEEVLAAVFGPDVEAHTKCLTPGCQWFREQMEGMGVGRNNNACEDFYSHVCGGRTDRRVSLHQRAAQDLMVAVVDHLLTASATTYGGHDTTEHLRMLRSCVYSEGDTLEFGFECDFSTGSSDSDFTCSDDYPLFPHRVAEMTLKAHTANGVEYFLSRMERSLEQLKASVTPERDASQKPRATKTKSRDSFCRWLGDSARCHLREVFNVSDDDDDRRYQALWNQLFFAPLFLSQEVSALWELVGGGEVDRKRVCAQTHEALFKAESAEAATAVLDELTGGVLETAAELLEETKYMLSQRIPYWLSRHEEGESPRLQGERRPAYLAQLNAVSVELAGIAERFATDHRSSVYSWKPSYDRTRNVLTVPHGLMALMKEKANKIDPVMMVFLSAPLVRALLPRPNGPYSWQDVHDQHLAYVTECFRSVHNATIEVQSDPALLSDLVKESALLGSLFDVYRMALIEQLDSNVYISEIYDNWKLFYIIWTMSHCGDPRGGDIVNAALRNSVRFTRSFDCAMKDAMFSRRKCNFWVYW